MIELKNNNNFHVITGGPGVGKTTLLQELERRNYKTVPEIARELIKEQKEINGEALPWKNKELYKKLMFNRSLKSFEQIEKGEKTGKPIFFDRGFIDAVCYATLIESEISDPMKSYAENWRYNENIFILPPWREIYKTDGERKQDWKEAVLTFQKMVETYEKFGYNIVEVPKESISERAEFVLEFIDKNKN